MPLHFELVTPTALIRSEEVHMVVVPGTEGEFGVLRGHASLLSSVDVGELNFTKEGKKTYYAVSTGYAEVTSSKVTILVETAERSDTIDKDRARRAKEIAEAKLAKISKEDPEYDAAKAATVKATTRLNVAEKASP